MCIESLGFPQDVARGPLKTYIYTIDLNAHSETLGSEPHGIELGICIFSIISGWC